MQATLVPQQNCAICGAFCQQNSCAYEIIQKNLVQLGKYSIFSSFYFRSPLSNPKLHTSNTANVSGNSSTFLDDSIGSFLGPTISSSTNIR